MKKFFILVLLISCSQVISAQFYDNHWMMGYLGGDESEPNDSFGISILSFYEADLRIENNQDIDLFFNGDGVALSDYEGDLLLFSNNLEIRNAEDQVIVNGILEGNGDSESILPQSFVLLPFDFTDIVNYMSMSYTASSPVRGEELSSTIITTSEEVGIYQELENILTDDELTTGELTACRHANGRDWWVLVAKADDPMIYSILVTPSEVAIVDTMEVSYSLVSGLGQAVFSPDGTHYARVNLVGGPEGADFLDVFDFDRCTGQLFNHRQTTIGADAGAGGVAISPSSQFLYVPHYNYVYQYDLWADDVFATKDTVAVYDGYTEWNFFRSRFFKAQLAPDGKIYMNSSSGVKTLHVIASPDLPGESCNVQQHSIHLPNNNVSTLANHPNYRLGPLDGSICDTLGLNNLPRAYYRIDRNQEDTLAFHFQDLSFYEPTSWTWTFGDGASSTDRHPDHVFQNTGVYEVCLTVSNDLGSDTYCRTLELGPVNIYNPQALSFSSFPNPVQDVLTFDLGGYRPLNGQFRLYNVSGQLVWSERVLYKQVQLQLDHLAPGLYLYDFWDGGVRLGKGKVVKR